MRVALPLVVLSGAVWALAFEATPSLVLPWLALIPFLWVLDRARVSPLVAFLVGWLHGIAYWLVAVPWIAPTVEVFGGVAKPLSWVALVAASMILGFWTGVFALLARPWLDGRGGDSSRRAGRMATCLAVPAAWVLSEWMRGHVPAFAFPWNLAGYAWIGIPGGLELSAWTGSYGLSFLLLVANVGIMIAISRRMPSVALGSVLVPLTLLAVAARFGGSAPDTDRIAGPSAETLELALVQPGGRLLGDETDAETAFQRLLEESHAACRNDGSERLIIWPESAAFPHGWETSPRLRREVAALTRKGCRLVINAPLRLEKDGGGYENAALLIGDGGVADTYAKQRLVPFGEYVPLAGLLPMLGPLARIDEAFRPGARGSLLGPSGTGGLGGVDLGMAICYEITFPALVARGVRDGAGVLVTITNDAWYGDSSAPHQHLRAARFRAAETGRPLVRAALTGISAVVDVNGGVVRSLGVGEVGRIEATVVARGHRTPYVRAPWLVPTACLLLVALGMISRRAASRRLSSRP